MKRLSKILVASIVMLTFILSGCNEIIATYDTIILGSGISGMTAALELAEQGKKVLIVEELGISGGNKRMLSGGVSYLDIEAGDAVETFVADIERSNPNQHNFYTQHLVEQSAQLPEWLKKYDINLSKKVQLPGNEYARTLISSEGRHSGKEVISKLEKGLKAQKVPINYNTTINKIESISKERYLVSLETKSTIVNVRTSTIIFAEDVKNVYDVAIPVTSEADLDGNISETISIEPTTGMQLLEKMGVKTSTLGEVNIIDTYNSDLGMLIAPSLRANGGFLVNYDGKRFVNEMAANREITTALLKQPEQTAYLIYDEKIHEELKFLDEYYNVNAVIKANTIPDLAEKTGLPENALYETIVKYSNYFNAKEDPDFGRSFIDEVQAFQDSDGNNQYYAIRVKSYMNIHPS